MPRSCSIFIQSDLARRASPRALTLPAAWIAPPSSSRCSVKVVLPASGWEIMAKVLRRRACAAEGLKSASLAGVWLMAGGLSGGAVQGNPVRAIPAGSAALNQLSGAQIDFQPPGGEQSGGKDNRHVGDQQHRNVPGAGFGL